MHTGLRPHFPRRYLSALASATLALVVLALMPTFVTAQAAPTVVVRPSAVPAGTTATFVVSGFAAQTRVQLLIGPANSEADPATTFTTNADGGGSVRLPIVRTATPGRYTAVACQNTCTTKATRSFSITRPLLTAAQAVAKVRRILERNRSACDMTWSSIRAVAISNARFRVIARVTTFGNPGTARWTVQRRSGVTSPFDQLAFEIGRGCA